MLPKSRQFSSSVQPGFTLIEMLVIVAILTVLASILWPVFHRTHCDERAASCQSNLKQIGLALAQYKQDYDDRLPAIVNGTYHKGQQRYALSWRGVLKDYLKANGVWKCPSNLNNSQASALDWMPVSYNVTDVGPIQQQPLTQNQVVSPATTIEVFEQNGTNQQVSVPWDSNRPEWDNILFGYHVLYDTYLVVRERRVAASNFLFADGHVKRLRLRDTVAKGIDMWHVNNHDPVTLGALKKLQAATRNFG